MIGSELLVNTNTFIYLLNKHPALEPFLEKNWFFSFITELELLGKPGITQSEIQSITGILGACAKVNIAKKSIR